MSGRRCLPELCVSSLGLMILSLLEPAVAWERTDPASNSVITHPGYPLHGEPYITQATLIPQAVSGDSVDAVLVVLSDTLDVAPDLADFDLEDVPFPVELS